MSARRLRFITFSGLVLIVLVLVFGMVLLRFNRMNVQYTLPDKAAQNPGSGEDPIGGGQTVAVTRENVQAVIASLTRPKAYSRTIHIELYYGTGSASFTVQSAVGEDAALAAISGPGGRRFVLTAGEDRYIWYEGDKEYYTADAASADADQMMLTYEDIIALDPSPSQTPARASQRGNAFRRLRARDGVQNPMLHLRNKRPAHRSRAGSDERLVYSMKSSIWCRPRSLLAAGRNESHSRLTNRILPAEAEDHFTSFVRKPGRRG